MPSRSAFDRFCRRLELRYFSARELLCAVGRRRGGILNRFPGRRLWPGMAPAALVLDELRAQLGAPITITSAYRCPAYNQAIGGAARSQHTAYRALDFHCRKGTPTAWADVLKGWRGRRFRCPLRLDILPGLAPFEADGLDLELTTGGSAFTFAGGIGVYPDEHFVHVDCRGYEANWINS